MCDCDTLTDQGRDWSLATEAVKGAGGGAEAPCTEDAAASRTQLGLHGGFVAAVRTKVDRVQDLRRYFEDSFKHGFR